jgi:divalent metal cation (Fe/Co/Zn/Cd) transporter
MSVSDIRHLLTPLQELQSDLMSIASPNKTISDRTAMIRQAFWLEYFTLAWMAVEAAVAIALGIAANSLTLVAFGIDSTIELASAGVLVWRLTVELRHGQIFAENAERKASRICGGLLFVLAVYVVASAGWKLWTHQGAEFSLPGLILCVLAVPIMYFLSRRKLELAERLGSRALRADAVESITCGWLSLVVVAALIVQLAIGAWWVDAVVSLGIVWFLIREGREAWSGNECCAHHH